MAFSLAVFLYKTTVLKTPITPSNPTDLWQVEISISARGSGERGSLRAFLPSSESGQVIFDEHASADRLNFSIRSNHKERIGIWSGMLTGVHRIVYGFRVKLEPQSVNATKATRRETADVNAELKDTFIYPKSDPDIQAHLNRLSLPPESDPWGRLRALQSFVANEIANVPTASRDALLTLSQNEGSELGKARLLTTLVRAAGLPARLALGLKLREMGQPNEQWVIEVFLDDQWQPVSPDGEFLGKRPDNLLLMHRSEKQFIEGVGAQALGYQIRSRRELLRPEELASMMVPDSPLFSRLSLYPLPLSTQVSLRLLLLLPLGVLLVSLWRNLIGFLTFGTFLPVLLALALSSTSIGFGLLLVAVILSVGIIGRMWVDRLRLLVVPRLSILVSLVVLTMTGLSLVAESFQVQELLSGVLFPVVILTLMIERFSITVEEEGVAKAVKQLGYTLAVSLAILPVFRSDTLSHLMFGFPELVLGIIGILIWVGGYAGFRLTDLIRFRALASVLEKRP